jgi:hypothetical protein
VDEGQHPFFRSGQHHVGRNDLITTSRDASRGTNGVILCHVLSINNQTPLPGFSAHHDDVARLHVEALHPRIPAGGYQATTNDTSGMCFEESNEMVARKFRDAVRSGSLPSSGSNMTTAVPVHLDVSNTERGFGWKFRGVRA